MVRWQRYWLDIALNHPEKWPVGFALSMLPAGSRTLPNDSTNRGRSDVAAKGYRRPPIQPR
jgi:hypothetical protein